MSAQSFTIKKKAKLIAAETDDGKIYVFGPDSFFLVERNENNEFFLNGDLCTPFDWEKTNYLDLTDSHQRWMHNKYGDVYSQITNPYLRTKRLFGTTDARTTGPTPVNGQRDHFQYEFEWSDFTSHVRGVRSDRLVLDSSNDFRLVSLETSYEKANLSVTLSIAYEDSATYECTTLVRNGNEISQRDVWKVSKTKASVDNSEFTLANYGIAAQTSSTFRPAYFLIGTGAFLILIVFAVKFKRKAQNA